MGNAMTVADILDALYDGVGSTWGGDASFVDEVAAWVDGARGDDMGDGDEQAQATRPPRRPGR